MVFEEIEYRGYTLTVVCYPPHWQVGIFPSTPQLPQAPPAARLVVSAMREHAIAQAQSHVDELLNSIG
jgi:hypothetical protein